MGGVGHLIGVNPDQAAPDPDLAVIELLSFPSWPIAAERLAQDRRCIDQERTAAAHLHFEQQRLALVNGHAAGAADRLQAPRSGEAALVEGMTGLVQNSHQGARKIALVIARRDPYIVGRAAAKRMGADIEPAMSEIEANPLHEA